MEGLGEFYRVSLATDMHEQDVRLEIVQVMVQGRDLDATLFELADDRVDFVPRQHEVAHHHRIFAAFLEGEPGAECEGSLHLHAIGGDLQVAARQADLVDVARLYGTGDA